MKVHVDKNNTVTINGREVRGFKRGLVLFFCVPSGNHTGGFCLSFYRDGNSRVFAVFFYTGRSSFGVGGILRNFWAVGKWFKRR